MITEATLKIFADLGIKRASPDHPIYSGGSMIAFINQSGTPTKPPPSDLASPPQTTPDQDITPSLNANSEPEKQSLGLKANPPSPEERFPDLQNLPIDPVQAMREHHRKTSQ